MATLCKGKSNNYSSDRVKRAHFSHGTRTSGRGKKSHSFILVFKSLNLIMHLQITGGEEAIKVSCRLHQPLSLAQAYIWAWREFRTRLKGILCTTPTDTAGTSSGICSSCHYLLRTRGSWRMLAGQAQQEDSLLKLTKYRGEEQAEIKMGGEEQIPSTTYLHAYLSNTLWPFVHLDPQNGLPGYQLEVLFHCNNNS